MLNRTTALQYLISTSDGLNVNLTLLWTFTKGCTVDVILDAYNEELKSEHFCRLRQPHSN